MPEPSRTPLDDPDEASALDFLRHRTTGATRYEIARAIRQPSDRVVMLLRELEQRALVRRKGGRWLRTGVMPGVKSPTTPPAPPGAGSPPVFDELDAELTVSQTSSSRWDRFRRLCTYYLECVRVEAGSHVHVCYQEKNKAWCEIQQRLSWSDLAAGQPLWLRRSAEVNDFLDANRVGRRKIRLLVGACVDYDKVRQDDSEPALSPIFLQPVNVLAEQDYLRLEPADLVHINHGWFEAKFARQRHRGDDFLIRVGLLSEGQEESTYGFPPGTSLENLRSALVQRFADWMVHHSANSVLTGILDHVPPRQGVLDTTLLLRSPYSPYTKGLMEELEEIRRASDADLDRTSLKWLFLDSNDTEARNHGDDDPAPFADEGPAEITVLNEVQRETCQRALGVPLLVVKGPPGTGKSTVVQHVLINSLLRGRSALFASRNHRALDAVVPKLNQLVEDRGRALILRLTPPKDETGAATLSWLKMVTDLITQPLGQPRDDIPTDGQRSALDEALHRRFIDEEGIRQLLSDRENLADLEKQLVTIAKNLREPLDPLLEAPDLPDSAQLQTLADRLDRSNPSQQRFWRRWFRTLPHAFDRARALRLLRSLPDPPGASARPPRGMTSDDLAQALREWALRSQARHVLLQRSTLESRIRSRPSPETLDRELDAACQSVHRSTEEALSHAADAMSSRLGPREIEALANLRGALAGRGDDLDPRNLGERLSKLLRNHFRSLLQAFPLWACSNLSLRKRLPFSPGVFDLAVIDEASQCDIASAIPLLYRSKSVMVVGDPMQLRHLAHVADATDQRLREGLEIADDGRFGRFRYVPNSFYDLAASSAAIRRSNSLVELVEHYRCHPSIARYFGDAFYKGSLRIRTSLDRARLLRLRYKGKAGILWTDVKGDSLTEGGSRYCPEQIQAVLREIERLHDEAFLGTVGVVTPFRAQKDRIQDAVHQSIAPDQLRDWQFICETADGFQGDERDLIIFNLLGGGNGPRPTPDFYRKDVNRFNVAISRGRLVLHVIGDRDWARTCDIEHLRKLVQAHEAEAEGADERVRWDLVGPVWEQRLAEALCSAGLPYRQQYPTYGYYLDFALLKEGLKLCVEVDGEAYHRESTGERRLADVYRDQVLKAANWKVMRFWVYELREDMGGCVERIQRAYEHS
ncbi:MAG: DUF559 domain-containing protein [Planctomycetes bacterium]|nr:DUF559 domain-containing protein [Planctomycetota bacterium]